MYMYMYMFMQLDSESVGMLSKTSHFLHVHVCTCKERFLRVMHTARSAAAEQLMQLQ